MTNTKFWPCRHIARFFSGGIGIVVSSWVPKAPRPGLVIVPGSDDVFVAFQSLLTNIGGRIQEDVYSSQETCQYY